MFSSLSIQTTTIDVSNPSLGVFKRLQDLYPNTLKCPCLNITVPYSTFTSVSITLHQVCSSNFTSDSWLSMTKLLVLEDQIWLGMSIGHFQLLSNLCRTIRRTIDDALSRLNIRSFVTLNVPTEHSFNTEMNATLDQFIQTLVINFNLLVNGSRLWTQIDQPFAVRLHKRVQLDTDTRYSILTNQSSAQQPPQVCCHMKEEAIPFFKPSGVSDTENSDCT